MSQGSTFKTEQEMFWSGEFGDAYIGRNQDESLLAGNTALFSRIFSKCQSIKSVIEFGPNIGLNLQAIKTLLPQAKLAGVEINTHAAERLKEIQGVQVFPMSILDFKPSHPCDLAFTKGVLIHISPDELPVVYDKLIQSSRKYVLTVEYYNPTPVEIPYRGHQRKLFKRDFAGEILARFKSLRLVDYGFAYHLDNNFKQDDLTWFLMEKKEGEI